MGQEIGVTPLQLVMAVSAIANGGWLMRPYVVSEVRSSTGETVARFEPVVRRRPISTKTAKDLTEIMRGAVLPGGTGMLGAVPGYDVAGKTGTAQKIDPLTGAYSATRMVSSFVGFLPADDPKLAILVVVDEPRTEHCGGARLPADCGAGGTPSGHRTENGARPDSCSAMRLRECGDVLDGVTVRCSLDREI